MDFLNKENVMSLYFSLNAAGSLIPEAQYKASNKSKTSYFLKKEPAIIHMENFIKVIVFGDMSCRPVDELAVLCEEVFMPLVKNIENSKTWPLVVQEDIRNQIISFNKNLYQVYP